MGYRPSFFGLQYDQPNAGGTLSSVTSGFTDFAGQSVRLDAGLQNVDLEDSSGGSPAITIDAGDAGAALQLIAQGLLSLQTFQAFSVLVNGVGEVDIPRDTFLEHFSMLFEALDAAFPAIVFRQNTGGPGSFLAVGGINGGAGSLLGVGAGNVQTSPDPTDFGGTVFGVVLAGSDGIGIDPLQEGGVGFFGVAPVPQQATPILLADVVSLLQAYGLCP